MTATPDTLHPVESHASMIAATLQVPDTAKAAALHKAAGHRTRSVFEVDLFDVSHILRDPHKAAELANRLEQDLTHILLPTDLEVARLYYGLDAGRPVSIAIIEERTPLTRHDIHTSRTRTLLTLEQHLAEQFFSGSDYSLIWDRSKLAQNVRVGLFT